MKKKRGVKEAEKQKKNGERESDLKKDRLHLLEKRQGKTGEEKY